MSGLIAGAGAVLASGAVESADEGSNAWTIVAWVVVGAAFLATAVGFKFWR